MSRPSFLCQLKRRCNSWPRWAILSWSSIGSGHYDAQLGAGETVLGLAVGYEAVLACSIAEKNDRIEKNIQVANKPTGITALILRAQSERAVERQRSKQKRSKGQ